MDLQVQSVWGWRASLFSTGPDSESVYRFKIQVTDEDFKKYVREAIDEIKREGHWKDSLVLKSLFDRSGKEVSATAFLGPTLVKRRQMNKGLGYVQHGPPMPGLEEDVPPELRDKVHPVSPAPEGYVWISEECKHGKKLGEELEVSPGFGVSIDRSVALILFRGDYLKGRLLRVEDVPSYVEELKSRYKTPSVPAGLAADLANRDEPADIKEAPDEKATEDARVLEVDYDSQGERYKEWKLVSHRRRQNHVWASHPRRGHGVRRKLRSAQPFFPRLFWVFGQDASTPTIVVQRM